MVILPVDLGKRSPAPSMKDPVVHGVWFPNPWSWRSSAGQSSRSFGLSSVFGGHQPQYWGGCGTQWSCSSSPGRRGERWTLHWEKCCCHSSVLPVSKAMTSGQKMLIEKVAIKFSFAPDRLGNGHLLAGKIPYLTPKLYLLVADSPGTLLGGRESDQKSRDGACAHHWTHPASFLHS